MMTACKVRKVGSNALIGLGHESRAAQGLPGGVSSLVYLAGFAVPEGTGMMDVVKKFNHVDLVPVAVGSAKDGTCVNNNPRMCWSALAQFPMMRSSSISPRLYGGTERECNCPLSTLRGKKFLLRISVLQQI